MCLMLNKYDQNYSQYISLLFARHWLYFLQCVCQRRYTITGIWSYPCQSVSQMDHFNSRQIATAHQNLNLTQQYSHDFLLLSYRYPSVNEKFARPTFITSKLHFNGHRLLIRKQIKLL